MDQIKKISNTIIDYWWGQGLAHQVPALAFYLVLSLAPLALGLTAVASLLFGHYLHSTEVTVELAQFFPHEIREQIIEVGDRTRDTSAQLLILSIVTMLWVLSGALGVLERTMHHLTGAAPFDFIWGKIRLLLFSALLVVLLLVGLLASVLAAGLGQNLADALHIEGKLFNIMLTFLTLLGTVGALSMLYKFLPRNKPSWGRSLRASLPAAAILLATPYIIGRYFASGDHLTATGLFLSLAVIMASCLFFANGLILGASLSVSDYRKD